MLVVAQGLVKPAARASRSNARLAPSQMMTPRQGTRRFASMAQIQKIVQEPDSADISSLRKVLRAHRLETGGSREELLKRIAGLAEAEVSILAVNLCESI